MDANLRSLIEAAIEAPSGENAQPWRFKIGNGSVSLYHNPSSDQSLYNYNNYGQLVCEGAAIENMLVKADSIGINIFLETLPEPSYTHLIGRLWLKGQKPASNRDLASVIPFRTTNRKPYKKTALKEEDAAAVEAGIAPFAADGIGFKRVTDRKGIAKLARVGSTNEQIMLGNEELHGFFFSHLTWTKEEDKKKKLGFYIKTLELPPPVELLFKVIRSWKVMQTLKKAGFPKLVGKGNGDIYASSAEIGVITVPEITEKNMIMAGRAFERLWLTAASRGLELQPLTGTMFMHLFAQNVPEGHFSLSERKLLDEQMEVLRSVTGIRDKHIVVMYRMGYGPKPSARASRFSVEELMI